MSDFMVKCLQINVSTLKLENNLIPVRPTLTTTGAGTLKIWRVLIEICMELI